MHQTTPRLSITHHPRVTTIGLSKTICDGGGLNSGCWQPDTTDQFGGTLEFGEAKGTVPHNTLGCWSTKKSEKRVADVG
jgi:hypothetical protein